MTDTIQIMATGGTFDKKYDEIKGTLTLKSSHLPHIMKIVRCTLQYEITFLPLKDSLFMDDYDRYLILKTCKQSPAKRIIIIHGTDTMVETGKLIGSASLDKTIILTGAMIPYSVSSSDAVFNFGTAVGYVQEKYPGTYICMNGRCFDWDNVRKNREKGIFEEAESMPGDFDTATLPPDQSDAYHQTEKNLPLVYV
ncbi:MAG: asparaginase [Spirochaetae bacterium HGW-Spirochaetae-4]|nr:MAG: asparaginase [Spirochaetae bacterium HGW-Spirochaetae-4]